MIETRAFEDVIEEVDNDILRFTQPTNLTALQFEKAVLTNTLCVLQVYDE